jgi:hypothetical protein
MPSVFLLWHTHDFGYGVTDDKLIGAYSSEAEAESAKARKLQLEGFRDAPDGFRIVPYELDKDQWSGGYVTEPAHHKGGTSGSQCEDDEAGERRRFGLDLTVGHPSMDPAMISAALGLDAHFSHRAGDPRSTPKGRRLPGVYRHTAWRHCVRWEVGDQYFAKELSEFVTSLQPHAAFLRQLKDTGGEANVILKFLGDGYFGDVVPVDILQNMAELKLEFGIECFVDVQSCSGGIFRRR